MLLQRVMPALQAEMSGITQFSTLSPMPLFIKWWQQNHVRSLRGVHPRRACSSCVK